MKVTALLQLPPSVQRAQSVTTNPKTQVEAPIAPAQSACGVINEFIGGGKFKSASRT
ncbi:hypothetical protein SBV1_1390009 [Verrucomicrobia bacterium]|nr:hypothetical protein SBV1_1390009 [Verrucomicrobiota bacterium]